MIETKTGLPNTCSECGNEPGDTWYAQNEDQARSGGGLCADCAGVDQKVEPARGRKGRPVEPEQTGEEPDGEQVSGE